MLASIAEFENNVDTEREAEDIAKENGIKFGRPAKLTDIKRKETHSRRVAGTTITQPAKEFGLGEATIYPALGSIEEQSALLNTTKVLPCLRVENNCQFIRRKGKSLQHIKQYSLSDYNSKKIGSIDCEYGFTFHYENDADLEEQINSLASDINQEAELRNDFIELDFSEVGTDKLEKFRPNLTHC